MMIQIRFHGRGGHGIKTASRIVGTAAFLAGYEAQDSPVYGAERRGAAVVAFTRISTEPIRERGVIDHPDLIVLADETLLDSKDAGVLAGQSSAAALFINTESTHGLASAHDISAPLKSFDITSITTQTLGVSSAETVPATPSTATQTTNIRLHRDSIVYSPASWLGPYPLPARARMGTGPAFPLPINSYVSG